MNCIDLTLTDDDDDDLIFVKSTALEQHKHNIPKSCQIDKDVYAFFYGTEDKTKEFFSIQYPSSRRIIKNQYTICCPKCHGNFTNVTFVSHLFDHYNIGLYSIDSLLLSQTNEHINLQWCAVKCEICNIGFSSLITLGQHLQRKHVSFPFELKQHFFDHHELTESIACPFCNEIFELCQLSMDNNTVLDASVFVAHVDKHLTKCQFPCDKCTLKYFSNSDLIYHRTLYHDGLSIPENEDFIGKDVVSRAPAIVKKSLNVSSPTVDISKITINGYPLPMTCSECHEFLDNIANHYQPHMMCSVCGYSSYCAASFRRHSNTMHGIVMTGESSVDVYRHGVIICPCGFQSLHGDKVAKHLTKCHFKTCFTRFRNHNTNYRPLIST